MPNKGRWSWHFIPSEDNYGKRMPKHTLWQLAELDIKILKRAGYKDGKFYNLAPKVSTKIT